MKYPNKLREYRLQAHISQCKLAQEIGVSDSALQNYEYGERDLPGKVIINLCNFFNITSDELLGLYTYEIVNLNRPELDCVEVPILDFITSNTTFSVTQETESYPIPRKIRDSHRNCYLFKIQTPCMNKCLPQGSYALVDPEYTLVDGKAYLVCIGANNALARRVFRLANGYELRPDSNDPTFEIQVVNFNDPDSERVSIMGSIVWYTIPYGHEI